MGLNSVLSPAQQQWCARVAWLKGVGGPAAEELPDEEEAAA